MKEEILDLDLCAREPIHIPGAIQPHGLMFVLREPELTILQVSANIQSLLGTPADRLLGKPLSAILSQKQEEGVRFALDSVDPRDNNPVELALATTKDGETLDGFVHRVDGFSVLELEPATLAQNARFLSFYKIINRLTTSLHNAVDMGSLWNEAARGIREMTGFDRVLIYRFAPSFEGEVVAEAKIETADSFLGLWFPASDIPEQARRLYTLNPIRNVVDADYVPTPLVPALNPDSGRPMDLSHSGLRSVSPVHCEYLRNMGVAASMSVSILREGRLWGLVACHHPTPRFIPYEIRKACTFIGEVLSTEIQRREVQKESEYQSSAIAIQAKFLEMMSTAPNPLLGLVNSTPTLTDLIPADGAAVITDDTAHMLGSTPSYTELLDLVKLLDAAEVPNLFATGSLQNHFPVTADMRSTASGLIALRIGQQPSHHVLFFRPELPQTASWGGNPEKPVMVSDDGMRLSPRKSFEAWKEEVKGQAAPWSETELRVANELRNLINVVSYNR